MSSSEASSNSLSQQIATAQEALAVEITKTIDEITAILGVLHQELAQFDVSGLDDEVYRAHLVAQISDFETASQQVYEANEIFERSV